MAELITFLNMGGYAGFVWPAYGLALVIIILNIMLPRHRERQLREQIAHRIRREARSKQS